MLWRILFVLLCLVVPVVWGLAVNWIFRHPERLRRKRSHSKDEEPRYPDYQI